MSEESKRDCARTDFIFRHDWRRLTRINKSNGDGILSDSADTAIVSITKSRAQVEKVARHSGDFSFALVWFQLAIRSQLVITNWSILHFYSPSLRINPRVCRSTSVE